MNVRTVVIVLFCLVSVAYFADQYMSGEPVIKPKPEPAYAGSISKETVVPPSMKAYGEALNSLKINMYKVETSNAGTALAYFQLTNKSKFAVKDIELACTAKGQSGTPIRRFTKVIYQKIGANSKKDSGQIDLGFMPPQTQSITCSVDNLSLVN